ncbi:MAG: transglycosylase SLT domain-containing protein [Myxococcota bacterium]
MKRPTRRVAIVLAAALLGCSSAVVLFSTKPKPLAARPPNVVATASAPRANPAQPLELEQFSPLLADPALHDVAEAVELGEFARAAETLARVQKSDTHFDTPSAAFWLGRLWERAGNAAAARDACERARIPATPLHDYAELCRARALCALGAAKQVVGELSAAEFTGPAEQERRLLLARAARKAADPMRASSAFRDALTQGLEGAARARAELELAETLLEDGAHAAENAEEALHLARRAGAVLSVNHGDQRRSAELAARALALLTPAERQRWSEPSLEERVLSLSTLVDAREHERAVSVARELSSSLTDAERFSSAACDARLLEAKALASLRRYEAALEALASVREGCASDPERGARAFYLSGRHAASSSKYSDAIRYFEEVEKRFPGHTLADDARYQAALAHEELGADARATELFLSLPDAYPSGDMAPEGLFRLALRSLERAEWATALGPLTRALDFLGERDMARGFDLAGRERFFRARALMMLGQRAEALDEMERIVKERPLSYYMLQAYSLLTREEVARAEAVIEKAEAESLSLPFRIVAGPELASPGFLRMMELLRVGEVEAAVRELSALGYRNEGVGSEILWGVALLYERAGVSRFSSELTRMRLSEVSGRWPFGQWSKAWEIAFPRPFLAIVEREAAAAGIDPALAYAIMREESAFDPEAVSPANAYGLMQLIVPTARRAARGTSLVATATSLKRPRVNVALGCREIAHLARMFEQNPLLAVPAYNAGPGRAAAWLRDRPSMDFDLWVERIPYLETRRYTKRVLSSRAIYAFLYDRKQAASRLVLPKRVGG